MSNLSNTVDASYAFQGFAAGPGSKTSLKLHFDSSFQEVHTRTLAIHPDGPFYSNEATGSGVLTMKQAESRAERRRAFQLVHSAYRKTGLTDDNCGGMRVMRQHLCDETSVFIAKRDGKTVFTVSLVGDGVYGLPLESLFSEEVAEMRASGIRMAEISCLASCLEGEASRKRFDVMVSMLSMVLQSARRRGIDCLVLAVHPAHAKVYERLFGCVRVSDVREYAAVRGNPAVLCQHNFADLDQKRYPLYDRIYGPTYCPWQLDSARMSDGEKAYFEQFLPTGKLDVIPMAA